MVADAPVVWTWPREDQVPAEVLHAAKCEAERAGEGLLCVLCIPYRVRSLNVTNRRGGFWVAQKLKESARQAADWAYRDAGEPRFTVPAVVDVFRFAAGRMDDENLLGGLKVVRDHLCRSGLLPDDSPRWFRYGVVEQFVSRHYAGGNGWVVWIVRRREAR